MDTEIIKKEFILNISGKLCALGIKIWESKIEEGMNKSKGCSNNKTMKRSLFKLG